MQLASTSESRHGECRWPTRWCPPQAVGRNKKIKQHQRKTRSCRAKAANGHSQGGQGGQVQLVRTLWISRISFSFLCLQWNWEKVWMAPPDRSRRCQPLLTSPNDEVWHGARHISSHFIIFLYISIHFSIFRYISCILWLALHKSFWISCFFSASPQISNSWGWGHSTRSWLRICENKPKRRHEETNQGETESQWKDMEWHDIDQRRSWNRKLKWRENWTNCSRWQARK